MAIFSASISIDVKIRNEPSSRFRNINVQKALLVGGFYVWWPRMSAKTRGRQSGRTAQSLIELAGL